MLSLSSTSLLFSSQVARGSAGIFFEKLLNSHQLQRNRRSCFPCFAATRVTPASTLFSLRHTVHSAFITFKSSMTLELHQYSSLKPLRSVLRVDGCHQWTVFLELVHLPLGRSRRFDHALKQLRSNLKRWQLKHQRNTHMDKSHHNSHKPPCLCLKHSHKCAFIRLL